MLGKSKAKVVVAWAFLAFFPSNGLAQELAGRIDGIARISAGKPQKIDTLTNKVQIQRRMSGEWINTAPDTSIFRRDKMRLREYVRVDLRIKRQDQAGRLVFLPDSLQTSKDEAFYEIQEDLEKLGRFAVLITRGSLVFDWVYGELEVIACGVRTLISGTRAAFVIGSSGDEGLLFLKVGAIDFPEFPAVKMKPGEAVRLRRGQPPEKLVLGIQETAELQRFIQYNIKNLWSQFVPFWQKPIFYVPAAAVGGVAALLIIIIDGPEALPLPPDLPPRP